MQGSYRVMSKTSVAGIGGLVKQLEALRGSGEGLADWDFPVPPRYPEVNSLEFNNNNKTKSPSLRGFRL